MTKQLKKSDLISQKLDHINYYREDGIHEAVYIGIARDACYTAFNSLGFKKKQLADVLGDYDRHVAEKEDHAAERAERFIARLYAELEILEERFDIEKAVYKDITGGEEWKPAVKAPVNRKSSVDMDALRKKLAA